MDQDLITKVAVGIASIGAGIYAVIRMLKSDRREDNKADLTDSATQQAAFDAFKSVHIFPLFLGRDQFLQNHQLSLQLLNVLFLSSQR